MRGERRVLAHRYLEGIDWTSPLLVQRGIRVFEDILSLSDSESESYRNVVRRLERDGYRFSDGKISRTTSVDIYKILTSSEFIDPSLLENHIRRIHESLEVDPEQAMGSAKELTESVFRIVLEKHGIILESKTPLPKMSKEVFRVLNLSVDQISDSVQGAESSRRVLASLGQIVAGLTELRNLYGTGHGRARVSGVKPRHARLAVGAAVTLCVFILETLDERGWNAIGKTPL